MADSEYGILDAWLDGQTDITANELDVLPFWGSRDFYEVALKNGITNTDEIVRALCLLEYTASIAEKFNITFDDAAYAVLHFTFRERELSSKLRKRKWTFRLYFGALSKKKGWYSSAASLLGVSYQWCATLVATVTEPMLIPSKVSLALWRTNVSGWAAAISARKNTRAEQEEGQDEHVALDGKEDEG